VTWLLERELVEISQSLNEDNHIEQYYQSRYKDFAAQFSAENPESALSHMGHIVMESLRTQIIERAGEADRVALLKLDQYRIPRKHLGEIIRHIQAMFAEFEMLEDSASEDEFVLVAGLYDSKTN